jgi:hypothetical protein
MGETTNPQSIAKLIDRYTRAYEQLKDAHPQLELVDTSELNEQEMVDVIASKVLEALYQKVTD